MKVCDIVRIGQITAVRQKDAVLFVSIATPTSSEPEIAYLTCEWGSAEYPTIGSACLIFACDGDFSRKFAIPFNNSDGQKVNVGEKMIFTPQGSKIYLKNDGSIEIIAAKQKISIVGDVSISGKLTVQGDADLKGTGTKIANKTFLTHTHSGVQSGPSNTGGVT